MAKTILIPVDFCVASLNTLKLALEQNRETKVKVVLLYAEYLGDSITELLFYAPHKIIASKQSPEFQEAVEILCNHYGLQENDVCIKLLHYNRQSYLADLINIHKIDEAYIPRNYRLKTRGAAFDPVPLIRASKLQTHETDWEFFSERCEQEQLSALFN